MIGINLKGIYSNILTLILIFIHIDNNIFNFFLHKDYSDLLAFLITNERYANYL